VRGTQAGHSTLSFDYRIVATALGKTGQRMSVTSANLSALAPQAALANPPAPNPIAVPTPPAKP
jgi:hypothetical protein